MLKPVTLQPTQRGDVLILGTFLLVGVLAWLAGYATASLGQWLDGRRARRAQRRFTKR